METREIYKSAIGTYGVEAQICMVFEEMSELQKELCKHLRGKRGAEHRESIAEEIADVEIMLDQMKMLFEIDGKVRQHKETKIKRLGMRLRG